MTRVWTPRALRVAPRLDPAVVVGPVRPRYALLINPFYAKDPRASFGKHVLTPTLALTSIAGATPPEWEVAYWDENLLQGPPPWKPFPQVVGITVHLTFAARAYALAQWYRSRGALVIMPTHWPSAKEFGSGPGYCTTSSTARSSLFTGAITISHIAKNPRPAAPC